MNTYPGAVSNYHAGGGEGQASRFPGVTIENPLRPGAGNITPAGLSGRYAQNCGSVLCNRHGSHSGEKGVVDMARQTEKPASAGKCLIKPRRRFEEHLAPFLCGQLGRTLIDEHDRAIGKITNMNQYIAFVVIVMIFGLCKCHNQFSLNSAHYRTDNSFGTQRIMSMMQIKAAGAKS